MVVGFFRSVLRVVVFLLKMIWFVVMVFLFVKCNLVIDLLVLLVRIVFMVVLYWKVVL